MKNIIRSLVRPKKTCRNFVAGLVLLGLMSPLHIKAEATASNYAEMALALATIPFNIAGHHCAVKNSPQKATLFHLIANSASLCNRALFFYNDNGKGSDSIRNSIAVGFLAGFDAQSLCKNLADAVANARNTANPTVSKNATALLEIHNKIQTAYPWAKVVIPPVLKGVTAFALACTQDGVSRFSSQQARCLAVSANSLTSILDKYVLIEEDNLEKKVLFTLLILNTWWLCYEAIQYGTPADKKDGGDGGDGNNGNVNDDEVDNEDGDSNVDDDDSDNEDEEENNNSNNVMGQITNIEHKMHTQRGKCEFCLQGAEDEKDVEETDLFISHCGHAYCKNCWAGHIASKYKNNDDKLAFDKIKCPHFGCQERLTRNEIQHISDNNQDYLNLYDDRINEQKNVKEISKKEQDEILNAFKGMKDDQGYDLLPPKKCPACGNLVVKSEACNHMHCRCGEQFCYRCGEVYKYEANPSGNGFNVEPSCKCDIFDKSDPNNPRPPHNNYPINNLDRLFRNFLNRN